MYPSQAVDKLLECPVCLEQLTQPKALPCQHILCCACVKGLSPDAHPNMPSVHCPVCRAKHFLPLFRGADGFPDSFVIKALMNLRQEPTPCNDCKASEASTVCQHCDAKVCVECRVKHTEETATIRESLNHLLAAVSSPNVLTTSEEKLESLSASVRELKEGANDLKKKVDEIISQFEERQKKMQEVIDLLLNIEDGLYKVIADNADPSVIYKHLADQVVECTTTQSLTQLRRKLSVSKNAVRLLLSTNGHFKVVWDETVVKAVRSFGGIEFGGESFSIDGDSANSVSDAGEGEVSNDLSDSAQHEFSSTDSINSPEDTHAGAMAAETDIRLYELPQNVNYHQKQTKWKTIIGRSYNSEHRLDNPYGAAYSIQDQSLYIADHGNDRVIVWDVFMNKFIKVFYTVNDPVDVDISDRHILVLTPNEVHRVNLEGELIDIIDSYPCGPLLDCAAIAFWKNHIIVLDSDDSSLIFYDRNGKFERHFYTMDKPCTFAVDNEAMIYVTGSKDEDGSSSCVKVFKWSGRCVEEFAETDGDDICDISGVCVDGDGFVSVTRDKSNRVDVYGPDRQLVCTYGRPGDRPGCLENPLAIRMMPDGRAIVVDADNNRIQLF